MSGAILISHFFHEAIDQWRGRHAACVRAKGGHFDTACELTILILSISVMFNVTCLTVTYIFNYAIMPATLANTFLFILQVLH